MTKPNDHDKDDEIDLRPFIHALWKNKIRIIIAMVIGGALGLAAFYASPPKWVATTYITKASLLSVYREVRSTETVPVSTTQPIEIKLYSSIQDDVFYIAMGIMTANKVDVVGTAQPFIHRASFKAKSKELAKSKLISVLDTANIQALNLNLPSLTADHNLRAFNALGKIKTTNSKSIVSYLVAGMFLALIVGCLLALLPLLRSRYEQMMRQ
jgi:hypothetical protein